MSLAKLPSPVKRFLGALEGRHYRALRETLAVDATLIEEGRHVPSEALRAWSESLFSDANFALYPTCATETNLAATVIVQRRRTEYGTKLARAIQQRWRFGISGNSSSSGIRQASEVRTATSSGSHALTTNHAASHRLTGLGLR
jgi:hypothetical protein